MSHLLQPTIVLLKDGSDQAQGKDHVIHNINACQSISEIIKTTLGPRGMDKLIYTQNGQVTISNDGRTIIDLLDIVHPAAKTLVDIAVAQDNEVGDGTTSVVILASEFLKQAKQFIEDGVHPRIIIEAYRKSCEAVLGKLEDLSQDKTKIGQQLLKITDSKKETNDDKEETNDTNTNDKKNTEETNKDNEEIESKDDNDDKEDPMSLKEILMKCAKTALQSKLISSHRDFFANIAVQAVQCLDSDLNLEMIGIAKVPGGSVTSCELVHGVAFKKTFSYAGFEQQPKKFKEPLIAVINVELELKAEKENAEIRLKDPKQYQSIVDAEWKIIYDKLDSLVKSGAKVILSKLAIGDVATQYFADRDVFCAGRVPEADLKRVCLATGATMQTSLGDLNEEILGKCGNFVEKQVGSQRYNFFLNCEHAKTATIILRGGAEQFIEETHRSLWDALMVVKRCIQHHKVVGGAGAIEMELSRYLRQLAKSVKDKSQIIMSAYARALEIIPKQLCYNAGIDAVEIVSKLRFLHQKGEKWMGVDIENGDVIDSMKTFIWEPSLNKKSAIAAATEAACLILSIDETIKNAKASENNPQANQLVPKPGRQGTGRPSIM